MQQLINIELKKAYLSIPLEEWESFYAQLDKQVKQKRKLSERKTSKAKTLKNQWETLCASGKKLAKKRGFTEKDIMNAIYKSRYNETA